MGINILTLKPGEKVLIPSNVDVQSIILQDGATILTDCTDLPPQDVYACAAYFFSDSEAPDPAALQTATIVSIEIAGTVYPLNIGLNVGAPAVDYATAINNVMGPVFIVYGVAKDTTLNDRTDWVISAKVPSLVLPTVKFKISGTGFNNGLYVIPQDISDCSCVPTSGSPEDVFCDLDL